MKRAILMVGAIVLTTAASWLPANAAMSRHSPRLVGCNESGPVRPRYYNPICNDGNWTVIKLRWSRWSGTARGSGRFYTNNCVPSCAHGKVRLYDVDLSAWRVRAGHYTRLQYRFPHRKPPHFSRSWTIKYYAGRWHGRVV
jgi:hypothetical protein